MSGIIISRLVCFILGLLTRIQRSAMRAEAGSATNPLRPRRRRKALSRLASIDALLLAIILDLEKSRSLSNRISQMSCSVEKASTSTATTRTATTRRRKGASSPDEEPGLSLTPETSSSSSRIDPDQSGLA